MRRAIAAILVIVTLVLLASGIGLLINFPASPREIPESITIGTTPFEVSGLIYIAENQGYFEENGLSPTIRIYDAGVNAMDALYAGEVDVATAADFVFARHALGGNPIKGIATIGKSEFHYLIARKDRGIQNISDLRGKKIGVARGTSGDFFLGRFLTLQNIGLHDVEIVDLPPARVTDPLLNGSVDAVSTWDPYAYTTEIALGNNAQIWPDQKGQLMYWIAICRERDVTGNQTWVLKFLYSLHQAEKFATDRRDEAKSIIQQRLHTDDTYMSRVWPNTQLSLTLDQSLILAMEDEARWMIANNMTKATTIPNFQRYIDTDDLDSVKSGAVNIIR